MMQLVAFSSSSELCTSLKEITGSTNESINGLASKESNAILGPRREVFTQIFPHRNSRCQIRFRNIRLSDGRIFQVPFKG
jgi:hypothetical protein